ncbi:MAG: hypothetical protein AVO39_10235 [delta proteobacterium MLS_D]|nr:MAG: hypothetical protein AVO39_10235 [delta proteobacterium MLS_D]
MAIDATDNALIELDEIKRYLKLTTNDEDDFLQQAINDWSDALETRLNRVIKSADYEDERHHGGKLAILLKNMPVSAISSITVDDEELDSDDYTFDTDSGIVRMATGYPFDGGPGSVLVSYTAGYETAPGDIRRGIMQIVALEYYLSARGQKALIKSGENIQGGGVTYNRGPQDQERIMAGLERRYSRR